MAKVALAYNSVTALLAHRSYDYIEYLAELDSEPTIQILRTALQAGGHDVFLLEADENAVEQLKAMQPELVFNYAEGVRGASREAHLPTLCELLAIPYTGSAPLCLSLCLDKARTKQLLEYYRLPTPAFQVFDSPDEVGELQLRFPLIVKLLHEGSSIGISDASVVDDRPALLAQMRALFEVFHQPLLVEEFIVGREFTVGVLGNRQLSAWPVVERIYETPRGIATFSYDPEMLSYLEQLKGAEYVRALPQAGADYYSICPAPLCPELAAQAQTLAMQAFRALGCRDWCRIDFRMNSDEQFYILELNPIASLAPDHALAKSAYAAGLSYPEMINQILNLAWQRIRQSQGD